MAISSSRYNNGSGFTLVEMLVVLVIMALTTTLLIEGLGTTWKNFEKLNSQQLVINKHLLPKKWFIDSFKGAQLYHPLKSAFTGTEKSMSFITIFPPGAIKAKPSKITWMIEGRNNANQTLYYTINNEEKKKVATLNGNFTFKYLNNNDWKDNFQSVDAALPNAIKVVNVDKQWLFSTPGRDADALMPTSIAIDGTHEI